MLRCAEQRLRTADIKVGKGSLSLAVDSSAAKL